MPTHRHSGDRWGPRSAEGKRLVDSHNPVFSRSELFGQAEGRGGSGGRVGRSPAQEAAALEELWRSPAATATQMGRLTVDDVIAKTAILFGVLLAAAGLSYTVLTPALPAAPWIAAIVALVVGLVVSVRQSTSPALAIGYAALEGVFVGGVSLFYAGYAASVGDGSNIVGQAVLGTLAAFAVMLVLYRSGRLRATPRFAKVLMVAGGAYLLLALASLVAAWFGVGGGWGFYGVGGLGILLAVAGVGLASLYLILDFDFIEQAVRRGAPERTAWFAGFGLLVTLVWLYLEILRLLALLRGEE